MEYFVIQDYCSCEEKIVTLRQKGRLASIIWLALDSLVIQTNPYENAVWSLMIMSSNCCSRGNSGMIVKVAKWSHPFYLMQKKKTFQTPPDKPILGCRFPSIRRGVRLFFVLPLSLPFLCFFFTYHGHDSYYSCLSRLSTSTHRALPCHVDALRPSWHDATTI